jgi:hypothetical protein
MNRIQFIFDGYYIIHTMPRLKKHTKKRNKKCRITKRKQFNKRNKYYNVKFGGDDYTCTPLYTYRQFTFVPLAWFCISYLHHNYDPDAPFFNNINRIEENTHYKDFCAKFNDLKLNDENEQKLRKDIMVIVSCVYYCVCTKPIPTNTTNRNSVGVKNEKPPPKVIHAAYTTILSPVNILGGKPDNTGCTMNDTKITDTQDILNNFNNCFYSSKLSTKDFDNNMNNIVSSNLYQAFMAVKPLLPKSLGQNQNQNKNSPPDSLFGSLFKLSSSTKRP